MYDKRVLAADSRYGFEVEMNLADFGGAKASDAATASATARNIRLLLLRIFTYLPLLLLQIYIYHAAGAAVRRIMTVSRLSSRRRLGLFDGVRDDGFGVICNLALESRGEAQKRVTVTQIRYSNEAWITPI